MKNKSSTTQDSWQHIFMTILRKIANRYPIKHLILIIIYTFYGTLIFDVLLQKKISTLPDKDFNCFYIASHFLTQFPAETIYNHNIFEKFSDAFYDAQSQVFFDFFYPPVYFLSISGLYLLQFEYAYLIFTIIGMAFLGLSIKRTIYPNAPKDLFWILLCFLGSMATAVTIDIAQNSLYTASFLLLGIYFIGKKPVIAGIILSLLLYKPQFVLLIPLILLVMRSYQTLWVFSISCIIQIAVSVYLWGFNSWLLFFDKTSYIWDFIANKQIAHNLLISSYPFLINLSVPAIAAKLISLCLMVFIYGIAIIIFHQRKGDNLAKSVLSMGILAATPYMFHYDFSIMIVPFIFYILHLRENHLMMPRITQKTLCVFYGYVNITIIFFDEKNPTIFSSDFSLFSLWYFITLICFGGLVHQHFCQKTTIGSVVKKYLS